MKQVILTIAFAGSIISYILFNSRDVGLCNPYCGDWIGQYQDTFLFFPVILFFSILTYKMPSRVFMAWWKFARISIPLILAIVTYINLNPQNNGGFFNMDNDFKVLMLLGLYGIFTLVSLIQIYRGYRNK